MKKKTLAALITSMLVLSAAGIALAFTCEVTSVEGTEVKVECKERYIQKYADELVPGGKVKVRVKKKRRAVEGC